MKALLLIALLFAAFSCAPTAIFTEYNVKYKHQNEIYATGKLKTTMPPVVLKKGESYIVQMGTVSHIHSVVKQKEHISYISLTGGLNDYYLPIKGNPKEMRNGMTAYLLVKDEDGERNDYLVVDNKKYSILYIPIGEER